MGASPKKSVEKKSVQKWMCQVSARCNGHRCGTTVYVDAPTDSEILKALYAKYPRQDIEIIEVTNKSCVTVYE